MLRVTGIPWEANFANNEVANFIDKPGPGSICVSILGVKKYGFVIACGSGVFFMDLITQVGPMQVVDG